jgi:hypothetical protein
MLGASLKGAAVLSKGRLTRHELSWLLTQEAQNAAERLRLGVQSLRTQAPPPMSEEDPSKGVETSLDALDDVMKMLSNLNQRVSQPGPARRGRIDLAALLVEIAPDARVSIEPGSGTEVYGDEAELRRMLQVLIGHGGGEASITVRREADDVRVSVSLGPDLSPTAETERAWLNRVVYRLGGRHELDGGSETLIFAADGANERNESAALRKELDEARKQGEVYARELAAVFDRGEEVTASSTVPPVSLGSSEVRLVSTTKICAGVASELRNTLEPAARELAALRVHDVTEEQLETLKRRVAHAMEITVALAKIGEIRAELEMEINVVDVVRSSIRTLAGAADRAGVTVDLRVGAPDGRAHIRRGPKAVAAVVRELIGHAIDSSPRGTTVVVSVSAADASGLGVRLTVDDAGPVLPASGRRAFLALETHAGAYGRPSGLPIFLAAEMAACQGAMLELTDAPIASGAGGLRVAVTFAAGPQRG